MSWLAKIKKKNKPLTNRVRGGLMKRLNYMKDQRLTNFDHWRDCRKQCCVSGKMYGSSVSKKKTFDLTLAEIVESIDWGEHKLGFQLWCLERDPHNFCLPTSRFDPQYKKLLGSVRLNKPHLEATLEHRIQTHEILWG